MSSDFPYEKGGSITNSVQAKIEPVHIRHATAADAELLARLGAKTFSDSFASDNAPEDMEAYVAEYFTQAAQAADLADPQTMFLIAEIEGRACGYAKLNSSSSPQISKPNPIQLSRLYVSSEVIGTGVGAALLQACIGRAIEAGFKTMWLGVWERNYRAQRFYEKFRFQEVGEQVFRLGKDEQRDLVMIRPLD